MRRGGSDHPASGAQHRGDNPAHFRGRWADRFGDVCTNERKVKIPLHIVFPVVAVTVKQSFQHFMADSPDGVC